MSGSVEILRELALALPETEEKSHFDIPDFRVKGKVFCTARRGEPLCMVKLPLEIQETLIAEHPASIFPANGAWGRGGATMVRTDVVDHSMLAELIGLAWRHVAPQGLVAAHFSRCESGLTLMADVVDQPSMAPPVTALPSSAPAGLTPRGPRRAAVLFIFFTALMDVIALGLMIPVLPNLIKHFVGAGLDDAAATARAAHYTLYFTLTWGTMQFVFGPVLGMLSDRFGRRPVLLISIFGLGFDYLFMALAPTLNWLFVGRVINGLTSSSFSTANAYVADVTAPQDRAGAFALMGAAFGVGFIIGPALGGLLGQIDLRLPFFVSAALALCNWLYGFFVLPESLPKDRRTPALNWRRANPIAAFGLLRERPTLIGLSLVMILFQLAQNVFPSIFILFVGHRWGWGPAVAGSAMMLTGALSMLVQVFLVRRVVKAIGERGALLIGLVSAASAFLLYGFAPNWRLFLCAAVPWAFGALIGPGAQSLMSRRVPAQQQGRLQGVNAAFLGVCSIVGPVVYLTALQFSLKTEKTVHMPSLPLLIAAGFCLSALVAAWFLAKPVADAESLVSAAAAP